MNNTYYLMRHGFSESNELGIIACDDSSLSKYGLTDVGKQQVKVVAQKFKKLINTKPVIISSDYLRAYQTAKVLADEFGVEAISDKRLRERDFGDLNGTDFTNYKKVWKASDYHPDATPFNAESTRNMVGRVKGVITWAEKNYNNRTVVLVSHGDPLSSANSYFINSDFSSEVHHIGNAEIRPLKNTTPSVTIYP